MFRRIVLISLLFVHGCTITQFVDPVEFSQDNVLCIIENPSVRPGFLYEYRSVLSEKGIPHKVVGKFSVPDDCEWTTTYVAKWNFDMALYMITAQIDVYRNGVRYGHAYYDSSQGGLDKFIDAESKIRELVEELIQIKSLPPK